MQFRILRPASTTNTMHESCGQDTKHLQRQVMSVTHLDPSMHVRLCYTVFPYPPKQYGMKRRSWVCAQRQQLMLQAVLHSPGLHHVAAAAAAAAAAALAAAAAAAAAAVLLVSGLTPWCWLGRPLSLNVSGCCRLQKHCRQTLKQAPTWVESFIIQHDAGKLCEFPLYSQLRICQPSPCVMQTTPFWCLHCTAAAQDKGHLQWLGVACTLHCLHLTCTGAWAARVSCTGGPGCLCHQ